LPILHHDDVAINWNRESHRFDPGTQQNQNDRARREALNLRVFTQILTDEKGESTDGTLPVSLVGQLVGWGSVLARDHAEVNKQHFYN
jgi:hypothetical protein